MLKYPQITHKEIFMTIQNKFIILGIIFALVLILAVSLIIISNINSKAMNSCAENALTLLENNFKVTQTDLGAQSKLKLNAMMKFKIAQYDIENLGNLSIMKMNMGIMQMLTFVITPYEKNLPLISADYMYILGTRKIYLEFYDLVENKDDNYTILLSKLKSTMENFANLEDIEASDAWYDHLLTVTTYKTGKPKDDKTFNALLTENLQVYSDFAKSLPQLDESQKSTKKSITLAYTDGLIEKGGISTDIFKKSLGDEKTKEFFDTIFFGSANY